MGFCMDTKINLIPKDKGDDPILTPGPNVSCYKSTKKILPGQKTHETSYINSGFQE